MVSCAVLTALNHIKFFKWDLFTLNSDKTNVIPYKLTLTGCLFNITFGNRRVFRQGYYRMRIMPNLYYLSDK